MTESFLHVQEAVTGSQSSLGFKDVPYFVYSSYSEIPQTDEEKVSLLRLPAVDSPFLLHPGKQAIAVLAKCHFSLSWRRDGDAESYIEDEVVHICKWMSYGLDVLYLQVM